MGVFFLFANGSAFSGSFFVSFILFLLQFLCIFHLFLDVRFYASSHLFLEFFSYSIGFGCFCFSGSIVFHRASTVSIFSGVSDCLCIF